MGSGNVRRAVESATPDTNSPRCFNPHPAAPFIEAGRVSRVLPRSSAAAVAVQCQAEQQPHATAAGVSAVPATLGRRTLLGASFALGAAAAVQPSLPAHANRPLSAEWEVVDLPIEKDVLLLDVAFTGTEPNHGALLSCCVRCLCCILRKRLPGCVLQTLCSLRKLPSKLYHKLHSLYMYGRAGFLLGSRQTLLETFDGGKTWEPRTVAAARVRLLECATRMRLP